MTKDSLVNSIFHVEKEDEDSLQYFSNIPIELLIAHVYIRRPL
jgi:hypothetical protein